MESLFDQLKIGDMVCDSWWRYRGYGIVKKKFKKTMHIKWNSNYPDSFKIFDKQHVDQFLERVR